MSSTSVLQLRHALRAFKGVNWVVVADEYPPSVIGGAEISLHECLKGLGKDATRGVVLKILAREPKITFYRYSGVEVIRLPRQGSWRAPGLTESEYTGKRKRALSRTLFDVGRILRLLARFGVSRARLDAIQLWLTRSPSGGILTDALPEQYALTSEYLNEAITALAPAVVLANNTRSILSVFHAKQSSPNSWTGVRTIAFVRDNRFHCPRHNQIMRVAGVDCTRCGFECAGEDARRSTRAHERLLARTKQVRQEALASMDEVVVTSEYLRRQIAGLLRGRTGVRLIPNFAGDPDEIEGMIKMVPQMQRKSIAVVGAINEAKGQREFLEHSLPHLRADGALEIHFVGRGPRTEKGLRAIVEEHGLESQVQFHGFLPRERLYAMIRQCHVVALPILWPEPFGRVPLEAALCGRPVVAFAAGGLGELVLDGNTGFLVQKGDYDVFWERIDMLLGDEELRDRLSRNARVDLLKRYSKESCVAKFREVLSESRMMSTDAA